MKGPAVARLVSPYLEDREVPLIFRVVTPGEVVTIPADLVDSFRLAGWTDEPTKKEKP